MEVIKFMYESFEIEFQNSTDENVMVNATQMAKVFGKRLDHFIRSDHAKAFIQELEFTPFGGNSAPLSKDEILISKGHMGTWMHRILALKFAAWLDVKFELWVYSTIDQILFGNFKEWREATIEKIQIEKQRDARREELLNKYPDEFSEFLELEGKLNEAQKKRVKAIKAQVSQLRLNF